GERTPRRGHERDRASGIALLACDDPSGYARASREEETMNLSERLKAARGETAQGATQTPRLQVSAMPSAAGVPDALSGRGTAIAVGTGSPATPESAPPIVVGESDVLVKLKDDVREQLFARLGNRISDT